MDSSSNPDKVDQTMDSIREQMELTNEISDAISNPVAMGNEVGRFVSQRRSNLQNAYSSMRKNSRTSWKNWSRSNWMKDWRELMPSPYTVPVRANGRRVSSVRWSEMHC